MKAFYYIFCKGAILLECGSHGKYTVPCKEQMPVTLPEGTHTMQVAPFADGTEVWTTYIDNPESLLVIDETLKQNGYKLIDLRESFNYLPLSLYLKAGKCEELLYWDANTKYCGICGAPMKMATMISKRCTQCGKEVWPQLATAIIVLIHKGDEVLLVHAKNFKGNFYGLVAGFVETGETLEEAVHREVREETGLTISNLRYFGSQPWPYPCGLMVGFNADYLSGEVHLQRSELTGGRWFRRDNLPHLPQKLSIARQIIDAWL